MTKQEYIIRTLIKDFLILLVLVFVLVFVLGFHVQKGNYMFPAVRDGDLLILYKRDEPIRTEVVVYDAGAVSLSGRIIAGPGDTVEISDSGELRVNGGVVAEEVFYATDPGSYLTYPYVVPSDSYFILNDFRSITNDSRTFGAIPKNYIKGKVIFVIRRRGF